MNLTIVKGEKQHVPDLFRMIKALALYENAPEQVETSVDELLQDGFGTTKLFEFFIALNNDKIVGIALYYYKYSTWKGKAVFLEDIIVDDEYRKHGIGQKLFLKVCEVAYREKCRRMDWQVLNWNKPAIEFYKKFNAKLDPEWMNGQLFTNDLSQLAKNYRFND